MNLNLIRAIAMALAPQVSLEVPVSRSDPLKTPSKGAPRRLTAADLQTVFIRGSQAFSLRALCGSARAPVSSFEGGPELAQSRGGRREEAIEIATGFGGR